MVSYSALQKVYRSRFDEGRSNLRPSHFGELSNKQPFVGGKRLPYNKMLGKNKEFFYNATFYKHSPLNVVNSLSALHSSLNYFYFDLPFLAAIQSDSARYVWFD